MVRDESPKTDEEILGGLLVAENALNEQLECLAEEIFVLERDLHEAIILRKGEELIYSLQDKVIEAKGRLSDALKEKEKNKLAMKQTGVQEFPPHQ